ncbi:hypothetical protein ACGH7X_40335 [Streptomyces sp. BBFR51]|uniref:hypothetical protein n=1 Tax=Streptomyces sp. BBFR51 TaxID=3372856 RepID=UPI0037DC282F
MEELLNITSESLGRFLTRWYGDPDLPISVNPDAVKMPPPLRFWHEIASQWSTPVTTLNHPLGPSELEIEDGKLVFWVENQGCWTWSTNINGDDSIVFDRQPGSDPEPWIPTGETLSEFLLHATVFEAIVGAPCQMYVENITEEVLSGIASNLRPLPLPHWRWPSTEVRILVGNSLLAQVSDSMVSDPNDKTRRFDVSIAAPSAVALAPLSNLAGVPWKNYTPVEPQESSWDDLPDFLR